DKARYGSFAVLAENAEDAVREIILNTQAPSPGLISGGAEAEAQKIAALYASFMDTERADALGAQPIQAELEQVFGVSSIDEVVRLSGALERRGLGGFFGMFVDNDPGAPERYIVFVMQGGI